MERRRNGALLDSGRGFKPATNSLIEAVQQDVCPQKDTDYDKDNPNADGYGFAPIGAYVQIRTGSFVNITFSADLTFSRTSLDAAKQQIIDKISAYVLEVKKSWGVPVSRYDCTYEVVLYVSRFVAAMLDIDGVKDATNAKINGTPGRGISMKTRKSSKCRICLKLS